MGDGPLQPGFISSDRLADRVSCMIGHTFALPPAPSIAARVGHDAHIVFSHFESPTPRHGMSMASPREEAFVFNVPLKAARFPVVCIDGKRQSVIQEPGKAYLFDLTSRNEVSLDTEFDSVRIHLTKKALDHLALDKGLRGSGGLRIGDLGQDDAALHHLAIIVLPAILNPLEVNAAFLEYIALALHEHVIHRYGAYQRTTVRGGKLASWQLRRVEELFLADPTANIPISRLATECGLSSSYFAEAFKRAVGLTPHRWLLRQRVEMAKTMLRDANESLASVAGACGFFDQSHFTRVFSRHMRISPSEWRRAVRN